MHRTTADTLSKQKPRRDSGWFKVRVMECGRKEACVLAPCRLVVAGGVREGTGVLFDET